MPWLRVTLQRAGFGHKPVHVGFVTDKVALGYSVAFCQFSTLTDSPQHWRNIIIANHNAVKKHTQNVQYDSTTSL